MGGGDGGHDDLRLTIGLVERPSPWRLFAAGALMLVAMAPLLALPLLFLGLLIESVAHAPTGSVLTLAVVVGLLLLAAALVVVGPLPRGLSRLGFRSWSQVLGTHRTARREIVFFAPPASPALLRPAATPLPRSIPLSDIAIAWRPASSTVELIAYDGRETLLHHVSDAKGLVDAVRRAGRPRRSYRVRLMTPSRRLARLGVATVVLACLGIAAAAFESIVGVALIPAAGLAFLHITAPLEVEFGADGARVRRSEIFRPAFLPYRTISAVDFPPREEALSKHRLSVVVRRRGGPTMTLSGLDRPRATLVKALLEEGVAMARQGEAVGASVTSLARAGDDLGRWSRRLDAALGHATYRQPAVEPEQLAALLCNPAADLEQRAAAAVALRTHPDGPRAIERALAVSSDPALRALLLRLDGDEPVEAVLGAIQS